MSENKARGPVMGGHRSRAMNSGEKAKDVKGAMKRLLKYMERYKIRFVLMFLFAIVRSCFWPWETLLVSSSRTML